MMQTRQLGTSDLFITPVGFGAWAIGGQGYVFSWGPQDDTDSIKAIHRALDLGINWIDTAAGYGLGHSEQVVARALQSRASSSRPYVFTKGSFVWNEAGEIHHSLKAASLRHEVEESLKRLETDSIDLYQIHWPAFPPGNPDAPDIEEGWGALVDMQREGKLRHIGVSNFDVEQLERIGKIAKPVSLQPPYSLVARKADAEILPYCLSHRIGVIVYSPMQSGLLSGAMTRERIAALPRDDWRRNSPDFQEPKLTRNLEVVEKLRAIGKRHTKTPAEVAIAWTLRNPAVTGAIVGARHPKQVEGFIGAADWRPSDEEAAEIER